MSVTMAELGLPLLLLEAAGRGGRGGRVVGGGGGGGRTEGTGSSYTWCHKRHDFCHAWVRTAQRPARLIYNMADPAFRNEVLACHNQYRERHGVAPLNLNTDLSAHAQAWAEQLARMGRLEHNPARFRGEQLGESMAMKWGTNADYTGKEVTDQWYSELKLHKFGAEPSDTNTGHFCQMVWRGSREMGVGKAKNPDGKVVLVVNYRPGGNVRGQYAANVLPPLDNAPATTTPRGSVVTRDPYQARVADMTKDFQGTSIIGQGPLKNGESRSTRTRTITEGSGRNQTTKVIVEETITSPDGSQVVNIEETTTHPDGRKTVSQRQLRPEAGGPSGVATPRASDPQAASIIGQRELQDGESRSVRTRTITEGVGRNQVTRVIQEETITAADGSQVVNIEETTTHPDGRKTVTRRQTNTGSGGTQSHQTPDSSHSGGSKFGRLFGRGDKDKDKDKNKDKDKKKSRFRRGSSSSSSSDSSPERGGRKSGGKSGGKSLETMSAFIDSCLKAHNSCRAKHGAPPLKHSKDLSTHAQNWAEKLASSNSFEHSACTLKGERIGENIACKWSSGAADYSGQEVADYWYGEVAKHDFRSERSMSSGHFSQMVWKASKEVGFGKAKAAGGKVIVVANYRPAGNVMGHYRDNVAPAKK